MIRQNILTKGSFPISWSEFFIELSLSFQLRRVHSTIYFTCLHQNYTNISIILNINWKFHWQNFSSYLLKLMIDQLAIKDLYSSSSSFQTWRGEVQWRNFELNTLIIYILDSTYGVLARNWIVYSDIMLKHLKNSIPK